MKSKKLIVLLIAGAMLASTLVACSNGAGETDAPTQVVTQVVTNEKGEKVTELVTDKNGDTVTEVVSTTETTSATTTTTTTTTEASTTKPKASISDETTAKTTAKTTTKAADTAIPIVLEKNMKATCKSPNVSIATGEVIIEKPGDYVITQNTSVWHGQIEVKLKNTEKASIRFENVHISNTTKNIIRIIDSSITTNRNFLEAEADAGTEIDDAIQQVAANDKAPNVSLSFPSGTSSTFETTANAVTGVLYNESKLTLKGNGSAKIISKQNANNCICSTKSITIKNVGLTLETAQNTNTSSLAKTSGSAKGIYSYSKVTMDSGFLTIKSNGDAIRCDRFYMNGGTANLESSACDAVDTDNSIVIGGGTISARAYQKYSFKVRRVNNTENGAAKDKVRAGKADCFRINGGKVTGESKKITSLLAQHQSDSKGSSQANVTAKIIKANAGTADATGESKVPAKITIGSWSSQKECTKFLYSSSSVVKGKAYTVKAGNINSEGVTWSGNSGVALIRNSTNK